MTDQTQTQDVGAKRLDERKTIHGVCADAAVWLLLLLNNKRRTCSATLATADFEMLRE